MNCEACNIECSGKRCFDASACIRRQIGPILHGYYIAATRKRHGDRHLSALAARAWRHLGHHEPGRIAGASAWLDGERLTVRVVANDLFGVSTVAFPPATAFATPRYLVRDIELKDTRAKIQGDSK